MSWSLGDLMTIIFSPKSAVVVASYSTCSSPKLDQVQESVRPQKIRRTIHGKGGESSFCWHLTLDARGKKSDFIHCLYALAGYNGMAFTPWVTLPGEKLQTYIGNSTQGHYPCRDEAA
ncbi:hypothetical protein AVEN_151770-1 [Araneus ventricosus]|uniref:Uncharacterized protein n=1 Tax=Araneus ventricosus TaxID=182803 RepID=A0A4Y2IVV3_ARAVE|nr:hypothetical protein AVEN_151770-1 [Araneus ventricosus]